MDANHNGYYLYNPAFTAGHNEFGPDKYGIMGGHREA